jgi:hypothetical protein
LIVKNYRKHRIGEKVEHFLMAEKKTSRYSIKKPFENFIDYIKDSEILIRLTIKGINSISNYVPLVEALAELKRSKDGTLPEEETKRIKLAKREAKFAQREIDNEFPILNAHNLVGLWSTFESTLREALALLILENSKNLKEKNFLNNKIKVTFTDYFETDKLSKAHALIKEIEKTSSEKYFIDRYENLFSSIGIKGEFDKEERKNLIEIQQVRNLVVHKTSIVDKHFLE